MEDILHVLRDCDEARRIWEQVLVGVTWLEFSSLPLQDWLRQNLDQSAHDWRRIVLFATTCWRIWTRRCSLMFSEEGPDLDQLDVVRCIERTTTEICDLQVPKTSLSLYDTHICWVPPASYSVKLNTDGVSSGNPGMSGAGGLLRDSTGMWIVGFATHLGVTSNTVAELHALRLGLILAWAEGYRHVECEVDAIVVLRLIEDADLVFHPLGSLILDIRELLKREWVCMCRHTLREGNFCADVLSKMGCSLDEDYVVFRQPPMKVKGVLQTDSLGVTYFRGFKL